jgi:hypothetical protein
MTAPGPIGEDQSTVSRLPFLYRRPHHSQVQLARNFRESALIAMSSSMAAETTSQNTRPFGLRQASFPLTYPCIRASVRETVQGALCGQSPK